MKLPILLLATIAAVTAVASATDNLRSGDHDYKAPEPGTYALPFSDRRRTDDCSTPRETRCDSRTSPQAASR